MHPRRLRRAELVDIIEPARNRAVAEEHDPVGDPNRDDFGVRRAAERLQPGNGRAGEDAERPTAVTEIVKRSIGPVCGVIRLVGVDEIAGETGAKIFGDRFMTGVIAGVEMGDADALAGTAAAVAASNWPCLLSRNQ